VSETLVRFAVGNRQCALPVSDIEEVIRIVAITPLAGAPPFIEGVINRRGVITPVIDLRKRSGVAAGPFDASTHILITTVRGRSTALIVDDVRDVGGSEDGGDPVTLIDPASILTDAEGRAFDGTQIP
jgi:purine-binding chemotaxis protein CheW